jgi:alpha-galactosidase
MYMMHSLIALTSLLGFPAAHALVQKNGVVSLSISRGHYSYTKTVQGKLPALGWNSWNAFGCDVNETKIMTAANEVVNLGLKDAGYEYINSRFSGFFQKNFPVNKF